MKIKQTMGMSLAVMALLDSSYAHKLHKHNAHHHFQRNNYVQTKNRNVIDDYGNNDEFMSDSIAEAEKEYSQKKIGQDMFKQHIIDADNENNLASDEVS